jgi:hypothetical protein
MAHSPVHVSLVVEEVWEHGMEERKSPQGQVSVTSARQASVSGHAAGA